MKRLIALFLVVSALVSMLCVAPVSVSAESTDGLPDVADLSQSKYFPPIKSQGDQGSCVAWAQAYYQFTYEMNKSLDRESTAENLFSPSFVYNLSNHGEDVGCFPNTAFNNMKKFGVAPWSTIPYNKEIHRDWFAEESIWQESAKYRIADFKTLPNFRTGSGRHVEHPDDPDLTQIKTLLSQGNILTFGAYIYRWKKSTIKSNPACPENEPFVGQEVVTATSPDIGTGYGHRMTLVGYNDNMWVDVNGNNKIDKGEMGAFKVANSFGPWWGNDGYIWFAYDNINVTTSVEGGLPYRTMSGLVDVAYITLRPYNSDADLYLRYTLNTKDRQNMTVTIIAEKDGKKYEAVTGPHHDSPYAKNIYSFDGTTNSNDGTLIFPLTNVVPEITPETLADYKWSIKLEDTKADSTVLTVKNAEIVDLSTGRVSKAQANFNFTLDGSSKTLNFADIPAYVPKASTVAPTTTEATVPTTTQAVTSEPITTDPTEITTTAITTTVTPAETVPVTTTAVITQSTDPTETTAQITTEAPITIIPATTVAETTAEITTTQPQTTTPQVTTTAEVTTTGTTTETTAEITEEHIYGDTNDSGNISISDATLIQKFIANIIGENKLNTLSADCNADGKVSVKDATCIQKYLAKLNGFGVVGEKYGVNVPDETATQATEATKVTEVTTASQIITTAETIATDPAEEPASTEATIITDPTEAVTEPTFTTETETTSEVVSTTVTATTAEVITTEATTVTVPQPTTTQPVTTQPVTTEPPTTEAVEKNTVTFTNSFNWQGVISCYYWSDSNMTMTSWPGVAMENAGTNDFGETLYTLEIPKDATYVIFTNGSIQTVDIPYSGGELKFYPVSSNNEGKYTVSNWS